MSEKWIDIFALSQFGIGKLRIPYGRKTVRVIIRNYIEGDMIRLTLGNRYGKKDVSISRVTIANCDENGIFIDEPVIMKFNSEEYGIISPMSSLNTDDMNYKVKAGYIAFSIYFKGRASANSLNMLREKVIVSDKGDYTLTQSIKDGKRCIDKLANKAFAVAGVPKCDIIPLLESISIYTSHKTNAIVAFGDSITQGGKWTYELAKRMNNPVLNLSISGNRLLRDSNLPIAKKLFGEAAIKRFDRDVLTRQGVKAVIIMLGANDLGQPGTFISSKSEMVTSDDIIEGLSNLALRAKNAGLYAFVCTHTPIKYCRMGYIGDAIKVRQQINEWIRNNKVFSGYYDFDAMIRDEDDNEMLAAPFDSGDHLHPSDLGSIKMIESINIDVLKKLLEEI